MICADIITQNADITVVSSSGSSPSLGDTVLRVGQHLQLTAGSNPTVGTSTSTWKVTVWYKILTP